MTDPRDAVDVRETLGAWRVTRDCGPWGRLRHMCTRQDRSCAHYALAQVEQYGGVLEHPAHSTLWAHYGLPRPGQGCKTGATFAVDQCDWGHKCRKPTWLYVVADRDTEQWLARVLASRAGRGVPTHCVCTGPRQRERLPVASHAAKRRTPPEFADLLLAVAARCG